MKPCTLTGRMFCFITTLLILCPASRATTPSVIHLDSLTISDLTAIKGERIFFTRKRNVDGLILGDIYSMKPDGSDLQRLTNFSDSYFASELPQISGDGTSLAFISNFESWKSAFYSDAFSIDLQNGTIQRVTGFEQKTPVGDFGTVSVTVQDPKKWAVSPSAVRISYKGCSNFVSGQSAVLTVPANEDVWVKAELAKAKGDLKLVRVAAGGNAEVNLSLEEGSISAEHVCPSLDGSLLAVATNTESVSFPFYAISFWGTNEREMLAEVSGQRLGGDPVQLTSFSGSEVVSKPSFSPDGNSIAFSLLKSFGGAFLLSDLMNFSYSSDIYAIPSKTALIKGKATPVALTNDGKSIDPSWGFVRSSVRVSEQQAPVESFQLSQNYPNPFQDVTNIEYEIQGLSNVRIGAYDLLGRLISVLVNGTQAAGPFFKQANGPAKMI